MAHIYNQTSLWIDPTSTLVLHYNAWRRGWCLVNLHDDSMEFVSYDFVQQQMLSWRLLTD